MSALQNCFFCCKPTNFVCKKEEKSDNILESFTNHFTSCEVNSKPIKEIISKISHYLQIPKSNQTKDEILASIQFCNECQEISEKLGELCVFLEVIQMKINYYLNLLTDQILKKDEQLDNQQTKPSNFQEVFHQNCFTKLAQIDPNPVLQLTKCQIPRQPDQKLFPEDDPNNFSDHNSLDEDLQDANLEIRPSVTLRTVQDSSGKTYTHTFTCDYCPLTFINSWNKKKHTFSVHLNDASKSSTNYRYPIRRCEYCGAMISSKNLGAHKRRYHANEPEVVQIPAIVHQSAGEQGQGHLSCQYCPFTFKNEANKNRHISAVHLKKSPILKSNSLVKSCEYCGIMISSRNLFRHKRQIHGVCGTREVIFEKCKFCGKMFEKGWKMTRHLTDTKICGSMAQFKCPNCGKVFSEMSSLERHLEDKCGMEGDSNLIKVEVEIQGNNVGFDA